jgi:hypothetical protein
MSLESLRANDAAGLLRQRNAWSEHANAVHLHKTPG